jgi:16S rRNA (cytidine1402-2'-O)-methyltransferase
VRVVPGPSAAIAALVISGFATDRFAFEGFAPRRRPERLARLRELAADPRTLVFFESPRRTRAFLGDVAAILGERRVALARELTKLHEEVLRGTASEVLEALGGVDPRGEVALVVEGARGHDPGDLDASVEEARGLVAGGMRKREAARTAAEGSGVTANEVYRALVRNAGADGDALD